MRPLLIALAALVLPACMPHAEVTRVQLDHQTKFHVVQIDTTFNYLIDPRTETCHLVSQGGNANFAVSPVPCDKLKRNVPEAARFITWVPETSAPATAVAAD
ncbi:hypothetical protein LZ198_38545 [Myxococcus sp. K15C18031901]|uniref:hypothetical protein n=1 Tax=Myxococcus dinghuensis TaxID=2906761 RepID=UPI0020A72A09|nr:hypothetical protein [Myxococcus dinghuensis]MCP3104781.1 hypothetical protein [Myxococcus dinghuensis]